jgi:hypothetical protein
MQDKMAGDNVDMSALSPSRLSPHKSSAFSLFITGITSPYHDYIEHLSLYSFHFLSLFFLTQSICTVHVLFLFLFYGR